MNDTSRAPSATRSPAPLARGSARATFRRLLGYLKPHRVRFTLGMLGGTLFAATNTSFAWFAKKFGDGQVHIVSLTKKVTTN